MKNTIIGVFLSVFLCLDVAFCTPSWIGPPNFIPVMPIYHDNVVIKGAAPQELRDQSVYRWMSGSFRIENKVGRGSIFGSGTLCYYDRRTNTGYIISCGHLFEANEKQMYVDIWYKNGVKLASPARYTADVIGVDKKEDIAFFKFTPDWIPNEYFPIAAKDINISGYLWSVGCDGGREVATYKVKVEGMEGVGSDTFLATRENSPRHGRSGGGLMNNDGFYLGICVRSTDPYQGTGKGLFVPLSRIHAFCQKAGLSYLLNLPKQNNRLLEIPIIDKNNPQGQYPKDYIPVP